MAAPVGAHVTIAPYDMTHHPDSPDPEPGDWIATYSERTERWGTAYRIVSARQIKSTAHPRRFSLRCEVAGPFDTAGIPEGDQVFGIVWYPREKRRRPR